MDLQQLPVGLGLALGQRPEAMKKFANMTEMEQKIIINKAHVVNSEQEMQALVEQVMK